jgi:hypothetical protein
MTKENTQEKTHFDNYKDQSLTRPRDEAWGNWKSWKDSAIGDKVQGYVADAFFRPEEKNPDGTLAFKPQRGITLRQSDGELINVGVKDLSFVLSATDNLRIGDPLTVEFTKLGEKVKGKAQAKIFTYYGTNLPVNSGNKTVKELTDADRISGGSKQPVKTEGHEEETADDVVAEMEAGVDPLA